MFWWPVFEQETWIWKILLHCQKDKDRDVRCLEPELSRSKEQLYSRCDLHREWGNNMLCKSKRSKNGVRKRCRICAVGVDVYIEVSRYDDFGWRWNGKFKHCRKFLEKCGNTRGRWAVYVDENDLFVPNSSCCSSCPNENNKINTAMFGINANKYKREWKNTRINDRPFSGHLLGERQALLNVVPGWMHRCLHHSHLLYPFLPTFDW